MAGNHCGETPEYALQRHRYLRGEDTEEAESNTENLSR